MKFTLLVTCVFAAFSLQSASAEDLIISPPSDEWKDIYEPDASQPVEILARSLVARFGRPFAIERT
ncbi:MAG: hypothetical protein P1U86_04955 [Verrucomicrobiales bacterium]|nr:hypothetical protein [Verrucomicrobiales bacterium]